jgi:hypothetical protein
MSDRIVSAVFDSREEAERALSDLRSSGIRESSISVVARHDEAASQDGGGHEHDEEAKSDVVKGAVIGTGAGALLGIAALAIPGVGPLAAAGAIAASAIPEAAAIGAGAGLAAGSLSGLLGSHGVSDEDAAYYEGQINSGGTFLSVDTDEAGISAETVRDILYGNGGHSASRARVGAA